MTNSIKSIEYMPAFVSYKNEKKDKKILEPKFHFYKTANNELYKKIWVNYSERYLKHTFNILGSGWVKVYYGLKVKGFIGHKYFNSVKINFDEAKNEIPEFHKSRSKKILNALFSFNPLYKPIDWQVDFKSGYRWSASIPSQDLKYGHLPGIDPKVPSDLERFYHLVTLGITYQITGEEKYAKEFISQILDWIAMNPLEYGAGWRATMNVAIRIANWMIAFDFFKEYLYKNQKEKFVNIFLKEFLCSLSEHGNFIMKHLEKGNIHANHYLADLSGILILSIGSKGILEESEKWEKFAIKEIKKEMLEQVYKDGVDFENATAYHRLVLEMFFYSTIFTVKVYSKSETTNFQKVAEDTFGKKYISRLYKMFDFLSYVLKPDGKMPWIGDNDNGRFFKLEIPNTEMTDMQYLLALGVVFFNEPKFNLDFGKDKKPHFPGLLLFGRETCKTLQIKTNLKKLESKKFPVSGIYISRSYKDYLIISCGPIGTNGLGGHSHNDKLSFTLSINGKDIIVDPGVYTYTASVKWRNKFRSTSFHNTVMIDNIEQNRISKTSQWWGMHDDTKCKCLQWETSKNRDIFIGEHYGYKNFRDPIIHRRKIVFDKKKIKIQILDMLVYNSPKPLFNHIMQWNFILSPECKVKRLNEKKILITTGKEKVVFESDGKLNVGKTDYAPEYGARVKTTLIYSKGKDIYNRKFEIKLKGNKDEQRG